MCKYCEINAFLEDENLVGVVDGDLKQLEFSIWPQDYDEEGYPVQASSIFNIEYCPMCGRKL